jgi:PIN domain nuclease of toxin-antitoxin system
VILLDTNAIIWLDQQHRRAKPLLGADRLYISPASLLELRFLEEVGRLRLPAGGVEAFTHDDRWDVDEPPSVAWFQTAAEHGGTRDPFDRLIVAHARLRGWKLASADDALLSRLAARDRFPL